MQNELDPTGKNQHEPGAKLDKGKPDVGLLFESFPRALMEVAKVADYGAKKYSRGGWRSVPDGQQRYFAAMGRHALKSTFEECDDESGLFHAAQTAWNALATLELLLENEKCSALNAVKNSKHKTRDVTQQTEWCAADTATTVE